MSELALGRPETAPTPATTGEPTAAVAEQDSIWGIAGVAVAAATAVVAMALGTYHLALAPSPPRFATVDLTEIVAVREMQAMVAAAKSGGDPEATLSAATVWPQELERTLAAIQADCRCVLLVRAAVIGQQLTDFTPELKRRLGLDKFDAAELRQTLGSTLFVSPRNSAATGSGPATSFPNALQALPASAPPYPVPLTSAPLLRNAPSAPIR